MFVMSDSRVINPDARILSPDCVSGKLAVGSKINLVLYHGHCPDGFAAAFAAWKALGDTATFIPLDHGPGLAVPDVTGMHVALLDFCFPMAIMKTLKSAAASLIVLDHHASAEKELADFGDEYKVFEMGCSGATLSWLFFHPGKSMPLFFRCINLVQHCSPLSPPTLKSSRIPNDFFL